MSIQLFLEVPVFVSSWRLNGKEYEAFDPAYEKARLPNLRFSCGVSCQKIVGGTKSITTG